jgi:putative transposase
MPWGLHRFQEARCLHFVTFSCYRRAPLLGTAKARDVFEKVLEQTRQWYGFYVSGYVVMPEHVHLLVSEPERGKLSTARQMLKQNVSRELREKPRPVPAKNAETRTGHPPLETRTPFWLERYYDFNVWSKEKFTEKLRYIHRNPVHRGLVERPEDWAWSSFRNYATGVEGILEIESPWTARKRERMGVTLPIVTAGPNPDQKPRPVSAKNAETRTGHPRSS